MLHELFQKLYDLPMAEMIRGNELAFPWLESVHVLAITLVVGSIAVVDLRLLGLASMSRPVTELVKQILPITWIAFAVAVLTGLAMFISNAIEYAANIPFRFKVLLLLLAGVNMVFFHLVTFRGVGQWNESRRTPLGARWAGGFSVLVWVGIVAFGRWIGFTIGF
jgi:uncharacterized protein DUF6644